jgi:16S rRNA (guanine(1405)-N(7))-methyltransferase
MDERLEELVAAVRAGARYRHIDEGLIRRIGAAELGKRSKLREAVKATRNKLHQVGGAYQEEGIDYARWSQELAGLPHELHHPAVMDFCKRMAAQHASTRERLPIFEDFYRQTLAEIAPLRSVLDVACGLNPLALPWLPLAEGASYQACDIYSDMIAFLNQFFAHVGVPGQAMQCDLTQTVPEAPVQVALVLKTIPCLEQIDKSIGLRLLEGLRAEYVLVSFPARSLGGRSKGMAENYEAHFRQMLAGTRWPVQRFEFASELAFLVDKR